MTPAVTENDSPGVDADDEACKRRDDDQEEQKIAVAAGAEREVVRDGIGECDAEERRRNGQGERREQRVTVERRLQGALVAPQRAPGHLAEGGRLGEARVEQRERREDEPDGEDCQNRYEQKVWR